VPIESDNSEKDAMADEYEVNYNLRFEDPDAVHAKLVSYGRDVVSTNTVRREESEKEDERGKMPEEGRRKRWRKEAEEAQDRRAYGEIQADKGVAGLDEADEETEAAVLAKLLEGDFSDGEWEERFGNKYY